MEYEINDNHYDERYELDDEWQYESDTYEPTEYDEWQSYDPDC